MPSLRFPSFWCPWSWLHRSGVASIIWHVFLVTGLLILHEQRSHPRSQYASHPAYFKRARSATLSVDMGAPVRCRWLSMKYLQSYRSSNVFYFCILNVKTSWVSLCSYSGKCLLALLVIMLRSLKLFLLFLWWRRSTSLPSHWIREQTAWDDLGLAKNWH